MPILEEKYDFGIWSVIEICSNGPIWHWFGSGSGSGMALTREQIINLTNDNEIFYGLYDH